MARLKGTSGAEALFGGRRGDVIRGLGGSDTLQGNGGNDVIVGYGTIRGDAGNDRWYAVNLFAQHEPSPAGGSRTSVLMGAGADRAHLHDTQGNWPFLPGSFDVQLEMEAGNDTVVMTSTRFGAELDLGDGRDTALILTEGPAQVRLGANEFGLRDDGDRDVVRIAAEGADATLYEFGRNDRLIVHGSGLSTAELQQRTSFTFNTGLAVTITLPSGREITVFKDWQGALGRKRLVASEKDLVVRDRVHVEDDARPTKAIFGSGLDDVLKAGVNALFLGGGDDRGRGTGRKETMFGEAGDDTLAGKGGRDVLDGGLGDDRLLGGAGDDLLRPGLGGDVVLAGGGNDRILIDGDGTDARGQAGRDVFRFAEDGFFESGDLTEIRGGGGADRVVLNGLDRGAVVIFDFESGSDVIDLRGSFGPGETAATVFAGLRATSDVPGYFGPEGTVVDLDTPLLLVLAGLSPGDVAAEDFLG